MAVEDLDDEDPLGRSCAKHGVAFANMGYYSACPKCHAEAFTKKAKAMEEYEKSGIDKLEDFLQGKPAVQASAFKVMCRQEDDLGPASVGLFLAIVRDEKPCTAYLPLVDEGQVQQLISDLTLAMRDVWPSKDLN